MSDAGSRLFDESVIARRRVRLWIAAAVVVLVALRALAEVAPVLRRPDLLLLDAWQAVRAPRATGAVVIVAVDEKSIARFGPPAWPRSQYVPLVEKLKAAGAKVIAFDFTFAALGRDAEESRKFADAMRDAGNVLFGYEFARLGDPTPPGVAPSAGVLGSAFGGDALGRLVAVPPAAALIEPEPVLGEAAAAIGHVRTVESEDGRIRVLPLVVRHGDKGYPSFGLQVARVFTGVAMADVRVAADRISLGPVDIPVSPTGEVLINWPADGEKAFPRYSFLDVVRGDVPNDAFRDKVVLVAGTASGLDDRDFPFAAKAPGVLVYAGFLDNVFRADFVREPSWAFVVEWTLFFVLCGLAVWLLPLLPTRALLAGVPLVALLVVGVSAYLFVQQGLWLRSFFPGLTLLLPLALVAGLRLTATERQARDVVAEKREHQKLLGLSFQEKGMLDMALATFDKLPMAEDMKLVYLNLGLDYENRGQRDKALLAYRKIHDADPKFEDVAGRIDRLRSAPTGGTYLPTAAPLVTAAPAATPVAAARTTAPPAADGAAPTVASATIQPGEAPTEYAGGAGTPPPRTPAPSLAGANLTAGPGSGPLLPGSRIGRYEIERHLGRGGMGDVYLVRDAVINRRAALKTIREESDLDPQQAIEMRQRFYREGQTAGQLSHPNIVTVYDLGEALGMSFIVMEFVEGNTLAQLMKKQRLSVAQIKHVVYHAAMGLDYAHKAGIFHRDVKPDNIMVSKTGAVKVMDFGIARVVESQLTKTGSVMGTPAYMSPEQVNGEKIDARSDVFSLGVILYELLTGKKPFTGETMTSLMFSIVRDTPKPPSALDGKVAPTWDEIVVRAMAKNRDQRYPSAKDLAAAVRDAK